MKEKLETMFERLRALSPAEREQMRREITGEADDDLIRRGDVYDAIRNLQTNPVPPLVYQRALSDVQRAISGLRP